jgi:hypothetical protein
MYRKWEWRVGFAGLQHSVPSSMVPSLGGGRYSLYDPQSWDLAHGLFGPDSTVLVPQYQEILCFQVF